MHIIYGTGWCQEYVCGLTVNKYIYIYTGPWTYDGYGQRRNTKKRVFSRFSPFPLGNNLPLVFFIRRPPQVNPNQCWFNVGGWGVHNNLMLIIINNDYDYY